MAYTRSDNQERILSFIRSEIKTKGYPPSVRDICEAVGLKSTSTVHGHLTRLEKKGLIRRDPTKPRAIEVIGQHPYTEMSDIRLIGKVTAGPPITAFEDIEAVYPLPKDLIGDSEELFMLRVEGESMIGAGILDGDKIIVRRQPDANNGEIVVAMIDEEATVKRFYKEKHHVRLQPENDAMEPIYTTEVTVLGKVIAVFRNL